MGAIDSIVDVISFAVCFDDLDVDRVIIPYLCEGEGTIRCAHGILPIPVPATADIVSRYGLDLEFTGVRGELVTPTGAAIAAAVRTDDKRPGRMRIIKTGIGAGKRKYERPGMLRVMQIEESRETSDHIWKLESSIDDTTGEALGFLMDMLFEAGVRDVSYMPAYMKKNRPGWLLSVICSEDKVHEAERLIFTHSTTIGIRKQQMERSVLLRRIKTIDTPWGQADVKVCSADGLERVYPEYESVARICRETGIGFTQVYNTLMQLGASV